MYANGQGVPQDYAEAVKWRSIPNNVATSASMVGTGPEPQRVADQISSAWLAFARTGNPATPELPWPAWRPQPCNNGI